MSIGTASMWAVVGSTSLRTASNPTSAATTTRMTPLASAASTSMRWKPKVWRSVAGRAAMTDATRATASPMPSLDIWPASPSSASDPDATAPISCAMRTDAVIASAIASRVRLPPAAAACSCA